LLQLAASGMQEPGRVAALVHALWRTSRYEQPLPAGEASWCSPGSGSGAKSVEASGVLADGERVRALQEALPT